MLHELTVARQCGCCEDKPLIAIIVMTYYCTTVWLLSWRRILKLLWDERYWCDKKIFPIWAIVVVKLIILQSCVIVVKTNILLNLIDCCHDILLHISLIVAQMCVIVVVTSFATRATVAPCFRSLWCARVGTRWPLRRCTVRCTCSSRRARVSVAPGSLSSRRARNASTSSLASHSRWSSPSSTSPTGPPTSSARTRTRAKRVRLDGPHFLLFFIQLPHEWTPSVSRSPRSL